MNIYQVYKIETNKNIILIFVSLNKFKENRTFKFNIDAKDEINNFSDLNIKKKINDI